MKVHSSRAVNALYIFLIVVGTIMLICMGTIGFASAATYPDAPENLTITSFQDHAYVEWDALDGVDGYNITFALPSIYKVNFTEIGVTPTMDGILNQTVYDISQKGILRSPNPVGELSYEYIEAVHDDEFLYLGAATVDNDADSNDDFIGVYFDFGQDGLTTGVDVGYRITEDNQITKYVWQTDHWQVTGGSTAQRAVGGAGTHNVTYEALIPLSELTGFTEGNHIDLVVRRGNTYTATTYSFFPDSTATSITDVNGWQTLFIDDDYECSEYLSIYTTNNYYDILDLDIFSWYHIGVAGSSSGVLGNCTEGEFITLDYPTYSISGHVYDEQNDKPVQNAVVVVTDTFTQDYAITDSAGYYYLSGLHSDTYSVSASYMSNTPTPIDLTVSGSNLTGQDIYIEIITSIDLAQTNVITSSDNALQLGSIMLLIIGGFGCVFVLAMMGTGHLNLGFGVAIIGGIVIISFILLMGIYLLSGFAGFLP